MTRFETESRKLIPVAAVIVTHNAEHWLPHCLGSLERSIHPVDVFVVDNASQDSTCQVIRSKYSFVHLIESGKNLGFGGANNLAFREILATPAEAVYLLNQDAWVFPDAIALLLDALWKNPQYGILSPVHCKRDGIQMDSWFQRFWEENRIGNLPEGENGVVELSFVNAAHWLIRRKCLEDTGGFAPVFFHYGEDVNFVQRARKIGWRIGVCPHIKAIHAREGRPGSAERDLLTLYAAYLTYACNPFLPSWRAIPGAWRRLLYNLFVMENRPPRSFSRCIQHALKDFRAVLQTRKNVRIGGEVGNKDKSVLEHE